MESLLEVKFLLQLFPFHNSFKRENNPEMTVFIFLAVGKGESAVRFLQVNILIRGGKRTAEEPKATNEYHMHNLKFKF